MKKSYPVMFVAALLLTAVMTSQTKAQTIFLDPGAEYITTGVGTEFILELKVDAAVTSLKSFTYYVSFDATKLDTVEVLEGALFPSSGAITYFYCFIVDGNQLQLEGVILGAGVDVSGPGTLATIRLVTLDTGSVHLDVLEHRLRDVGTDLIASTAVGGEVHCNVAPAPFDLISPIGGIEVSGLPGDDFELTWTPSATVYPGESVGYTVEYSSIPSFDPLFTTSIPGLTGTSYTLAVNDLVEGYEGPYYWRVRAVGDLHGFERYGAPGYESFQFMYDHIPPTAFDLISPADASEMSGVAEVLYDWEDALTIVPGDLVDYTLYIGPNPSLPAGALLAQPASASEVAAGLAGLPRNQPLYWTVAATNSYDQETWATSTYTITFLGCCVDRVGDANDTGGDEPTIGDVSVMIDAKFITGVCQDGEVEIIPCLQEADINQSGGVDPTCGDITIGDISVLIDYLFITGPSLGLADCL